MRFTILSGATALFFSTASFAVPSIEKQAQFFAGVFLIESKNDLRAEDRAAKFRELEAVTGVTAAEACALVASYRENPGQWHRLYEMIASFINAVPLPPKSGDTAAAVPQATMKRR